MKRFVVAFLILTSSIASSFSSAQAPQPAKQSGPKKTAASAGKPRGTDAARIAQITIRMKSFVDRGRAAGIVTLVGHRGQIVNLSAVGNQDMEAQTPMKLDTIFQIASMTKPVTAAGIMLLVEDGLLAITDPVQRYLPNFAKIQLMTKSEEGDLQEIRNPARQITIRDLLTHTSGMAGSYRTSSTG